MDPYLSNAEIVYRFVALFSSYENVLRSYGSGKQISMTNMHVLSDIEAHPEITATDLAVRHLCSKSAISQVLRQLEEQGYLIRVPSNKDSKKKMLFVSAEGKKMCQLHDEFDRKSLKKTHEYLRRDCTEEEIETFYKVMGAYNKIMEANNLEHRRLIAKQKKEQEGEKTQITPDRERKSRDEGIDFK